MIFSAGICATLAGAASAMLVPPSVQTSDVPALVDPYTQLVQLECPGCKYAKPTEKGFEWTDNVENALLLNVSVGTSSHTLELNGVQFYPPVMSLMASPAVPYISQVPAGFSLVQLREKASNYLSRPLRLTGWGFRAGSAHTVNESGEEVLKIHLQLNALEQQPIHVPQITITALKNTNGQLMILKVDKDSPAAAPQRQQACKDWPLLCRWRAIVAQRLEALRGRIRGSKCNKHLHYAPHGRPHISHPQYGRPIPGVIVATEEDMGHHGHGHGHHRAHGHGHGKGFGHWRHGHHKLRRIMHTIARVVLTVLIPILIGVCAGVITYMLGMLLGTGAALLWMNVRGERSQYAPIALEEGEESPERESFEKGEMVEEEVVEAPPVYVEVEAREVRQE